MVADLAKLQVVCHAAACKETRCGDRSATSASRRAKDGLLKWHGQVNVLRHDVGSLAAWEGCAQQDCTSTDEVPPSGCNFLGEDCGACSYVVCVSWVDAKVFWVNGYEVMGLVRSYYMF